MKKISILLLAIFCGWGVSAQNPFDVNNNVNVTKRIGDGGGNSTSNQSKNTNINEVPTFKGMVFKGDKSSDPLYYKIVDDVNRLVEVTGDVRSANLKGKISIQSTVNTHGKTYKVVNIGEGAFKDCKDITSVEVMGNNLQKLCHNCFTNCISLVNISLNPNCCNLKSDAFVNCTKLEVIKAPKNANNFTFEKCNAKIIKF